MNRPEILNRRANNPRDMSTLDKPAKIASIVSLAAIHVNTVSSATSGNLVSVHSDIEALPRDPHAKQGPVLSPPLPGALRVEANLANLRGKQWTEPVPPVAHRLVADLHASFVEQVLHIPKRQREPDIHHHRQAYDRRAGAEVAKWAALGHIGSLARSPARLKPHRPDRAGAFGHPQTLSSCLHHLKSICSDCAPSSHTGDASHSSALTAAYACSDPEANRAATHLPAAMRCWT